MKCPHCGAVNPEDQAFCADCGQPLKQPEPERAAEPELGQEPLFEAGPETGEAPKKKTPVALIVTAGVVVVALAVMVLILVRQAIPGAGSAPDSAPLTGEVITSGGSAAETVDATPAYPVTAYASPALVPAESMDRQVGSCGGIAIDNRALNYFYWGEFNYLCNVYGSALYQLLDPTVPLGEQSYNGAADYTWQDLMLENAVDTMEQTFALIQLAREAGFGLTEADTAYLDQMLGQLRSAAVEYGYSDLESYLKSAYGSGATEESFRSFMEDNILASNYASELCDGFSFTEEEIRAYYDIMDYANLAQDEQRNIDVRHILIQTRTDESGAEDWDATLAEAERILALWESSPTEEHFAALAEEYTEDPGSQYTGGLYTGVQRGQMVQSFNDWCFDESRQPGDTGIVRTGYGYHIMYFVAHAARPAWMETVENDMRAEVYANTIAAAVAQYGFEIDYSAVVLTPPVGMYE